MKPIHIRIQNYYSQTGILDNALFQWQYAAGKSRQTAYQIDIFRKDTLFYTTGKLSSNKQNHISLAAVFAEQEIYQFAVHAWDERDMEEVSDLSCFCTGVFKWRGSFIGNKTKKPFLARRQFHIRAGKIPQAVLSVCVPGQFEAKLNGKKIGGYAYEGSQTDFHKHVHYSTYQVGNLLHVGKNELTIEVANGWYIGDDSNGSRHFYTMDKGYQPFGEELSVLAQLRIDNQFIVTDTTWEVSASNCTLADIYGSEDIDLTIPLVWTPAQEVRPPKGSLIPCQYPPVIRKASYAPAHIDKERLIFDFGQNMSSQFSLKIKGYRGQTVKLIPVEKLSPTGDIEPSVNTCSILTLSGGEDFFEQKFSVSGARWYQVEGAEFSQIISLRSYFVTSSAETTGHFQCSDNRLNQIYQMILKAIESNLNHLHTDCPTIEKLGWLEPNHLMARAIMYNKDVDLLWDKISMDMRDAQYMEGEQDVDTGAFPAGGVPHEYKEGLIPSIAPRYAKFTTDWGEGSFWDILPWGSSVILAPWEQYQFYGNADILEKNYESAKRYILYLTEQYEAYSRLHGKSGTERFICCGLGDWGISQNKGENRENIETAYYYHVLTVMADISELLKKPDTGFFRSQALLVKEDYNKALLVTGDTAYYRSFYNENNREITQANQAIPLEFGIVPEKYRTQVQKTLLSLCEGKHLKCGEIGLVYILRALSAMNRNDVIYHMILQEEHPSYLRFVNTGETTLPEFWRDDARSRNHDMLGHIMEWFFTQLAGITGADGFKTISIAPKCMEFITDFECCFHSPYGKISVCCHDGHIETSVPANTF